LTINSPELLALSRSRKLRLLFFPVHCLYVICPECGGELSKKWNPQTAAKAVSAKVIAWTCSVCGGQFSREEVASPSHPRRNLSGHES